VRPHPNESGGDLIAAGLVPRLKRLVLYRLILGIALLAISRNAPQEIPALGWLSTYSALAVALFLFTIMHAFWLNQGRSPQLNAIVQVAGDLVFIALLQIVSGQVDSYYRFLFGLEVAVAAFLGGRRLALWAALGAGVALVGIIWADLAGADWISVSFVRGLLIQLLGLVLIALLAGTLSERANKAEWEARQALREQDRLVSIQAAILDHSPQATLAIDAQGVIRFANPAALALFPSPIGQSLFNLDPQLAAMCDHHSSGRNWLEEERGRFVGDNLFEERIVIAPVLQGWRLILIFDLTLQRQQTALLKRSEQLAWLGQMSAALAHEIRNPLATIDQGAHLIQHTDTEEERLELSQIIHAEVARLSRLVDQYLFLSRPHRGHPFEPAGPLLTRTLESIRQAFGARMTLHAEIDPELSLPLNEDSAAQILWNMARNARELTPELHNLWIRAEMGAEGPTLIVEDDGPGIPPKVRSKVFEPFVSGRTSGTGLGLSVVASIVEAGHGRIEATDRPGGGARFIMTWPPPPPSATTPVVS